jgi:hypothetical protein
VVENGEYLGKNQKQLYKIQRNIGHSQKICEDGILAHMMTEACRSFFKETATPIVNCINNHFKNNVDAFLAKYTANGKFTHCKFHKKCSGIGDSCGKSG